MTVLRLEHIGTWHYTLEDQLAPPPPRVPMTMTRVAGVRHRIEHPDLSPVAPAPERVLAAA